MEDHKIPVRTDFRNISMFSLVIGIYLLFLALMVVSHGYNGSFIYLNSNFYSWLDLPMFILTHLGDSLILAAIISLALIQKKPHVVLNLIIAVTITGILGQILKQVCFEGWDRPLRVFGENGGIHSLPNYRLFHNSFPSGHSITVTSAFTILLLSIQSNKFTQAFYALIVIVVTYSRVYLGAHFPADVLTGAMIGFFMSWLIFILLNPKTSMLKYSRNFKIIIAVLAIISLIAGIWLLRIYFI